MNKYPFSPITPAERARAEEALRESEEHLSALIHQTLSGIAETDTDGTFLLVNDRYCAITGYAREELIGHRRVQELTHPDDRPRNLELLARCATEGVPFEIEKRYIRKDGSLVWVNNSVSAIRRSDGSIQSLLAVSLDITARKQAEQQLARDLDAMTRLQELGTLSVQGSDLDAVLTQIVDVAIAINSADFGNIQLRDPVSGDLRIVAQRGFPSWWLEFWDAVSKGQGVCGTALERSERIIVEDVEQSPIFVGTPGLDIQRKAGVRAVQSTPLISRSGKMVGMFSTHYRMPHQPDERALRLIDLLAHQAAEIVEHAQIESALRESEQRLREAQRIAGLGNWDWNLRTGETRWSPEIYIMHGQSLDAPTFTLDELLKHLHPEDVERVKTVIFKAISEGAQANFDYRTVLPDGSIRVIHAVGEVTEFDSEGRPLIMVGTNQDVTERKRREMNSAFLDEITNTLARLSTPEEIITTVGAKIGDYLKIQSCLFIDVEEARDEVRVDYSWQTGEIPNLRGTYRISNFLSDELRIAARAGEPFVVNDTQTDARTSAANYGALNIHSFITVPGRRNFVWKFLLTVHCANKREWRADEIELVKELTARLFPRLERARAEAALRASEERYRWYTFQYSRVGGAGSPFIAAVFDDITERKRREQEQEYLLKLSDALRTEADPIVIEETVTRLAMDFFAADRCYYAAIEGDQAIISRDAQRGDLPSVAATYRMSDFPIFQKVVDEGCPFVVYDANATDVLDEELREMCLRMSVVSFVDVPVIKNGKVAGVFSLVQSAPRQWTQTEVDLMVVTAERIWAAVERATAERNLIVSEGRFRTITEAAPALVWVCSAPDGANIFFSQKWYEFTGQTREEAAGYGWTNATHPEDWERIVPYWQRCQQTGEPYQGEVRYRRRDGEWRWFNFRALPLRTSSGSIESWYGISIEINDEKIAKEALRESQMRMTSLFQHAQNAILLVNNEACYVDANPAACHLTGLTREELLQKNVWDLTPEPEKESGLQLWREFLRAGQQAGEYALRRKDGTLRIVEFRAVANILPGLHLSVLQDVTERKETEAALQRAYDELAKANAELLGQEKERRELVRRLISAQEVERQRLSLELHDQTAQHLAALRMLLGALSEPLESHPEHFEILTQVQRLTEQLSRELHTLAWELRPMRLQEAGLAAAAEQYVKEWSVRCGIVADFHFRGDRQRRFPGLHEITVYRFIQEALTNALKYSQARQVTVALEYFPDRLRAIVEDDGVGFDPEQSAEINGGLGLRGIRERLALVNGELEIESSLGHGTALFLNLPLPDNQQPKGAS